MRHRLGGIAAIAGGLLVTVWALHVAGAGDDKPAQKDAPPAKQASPKKVVMQAFMRKKLEASQSLLEGLAVEDFDLIATGARQLKTTSAAAEFMVIRDPLYTQHADEFRRIVEKLEKAGKARNLDAATLAYVDMTMSCVECHKYVRNVQIADK
jgi:hypothetical protein